MYGTIKVPKLPEQKILKNKSGAITLHAFKLYYRPLITKLYGIGIKPDDMNQWNKIAQK